MIHATVIGNLGKDPERRNMGDGTAVLRLTVASNSRQKVGNEWKSVPTWVSVDLVGKRAESLANILHKGSQVAVRGSLALREYDRRDGTKGQSLDMRADEVELLGSANGQSRGDSRGESRDEFREVRGVFRPQTVTVPAAPAADYGNDYEDVPF